MIQNITENDLIKGRSELRASTDITGDDIEMENVYVK